MKFSSLQENLKQGLNIVSHIASKSTSLPILNNVLITAEEGGIKLMTTNLEVGISCMVRGKIEKKGSYTVNSKLINDYVSLLPNETVNVELSDDFLNIDCLNYDTKIKGNTAEEFPLIPELKKENPYICEVEELLKSLNQTLFAASISETRPEISGVYFNFSGDSLTIASTDSYRLAEKVIKLKEKTAEDKEVIIPARTLTELVRILSSIKKGKEEEGEKTDQFNVEIYFEDNQILFSFDSIELVSRIIEGQYPNYKQIIPEAYKTKAIININELSKAVKTASLFSRTGIFDVNLQIKGKNLVVFSTNNQLGENKTEVGANIEGEDNEIIVNYRYLLDGLASMDATEIIFEMTDPSNPCLIKPAESLEGAEPIAVDEYLYIVMPIKQ